MAVNFSKNQDEITKAWRDVTDSSNTPKWALFGYEGSTNFIKLMATGTQGLDELVEEFNCSLIQYAFCRVIDESLGLNRLILINWQGESAPLSRKGLCASHVGDVSNYFKGCAQTITIRNDDEATKEHLMEQILKTSASRMGLPRISSQPSATTTSTSTTNDKSMSSFNESRTLNETNDSSSVDASVSSSTETATTNTPSSVYKKVDIGSDIAASRKSFWQRQEEEEKERLAEEKRRAAEKQAQFEKERKQREESEAKKLAETIRQREQLIEATKKADKNSASANQPSSIVSTTTATDISDDDGRVGRRSELIRLERNQETQSLITKGLIKNKRAIFEQAQQQQQQQQQPALSRRSSGAIITKRVNAFKSLDISSNSNLDSTNDGSATTNTVGKLSNSFAKQINIDGDESANASSVEAEDNRQASNVNSTPVKREVVEAVTLVRDDESSATQSPQSVVGTPNESATANLDESLKNTSSASQTKSNENGARKVTDESQDVNGNSEKSFSIKSSPIKEAATTEQANDELITNEQLIMNGKSSNIKAIALYDYQAADNTEISFDPDDQIGHIQKVDSGWWHGQVLTGTYKGQIGLFPANYVQEL